MVTRDDELRGIIKDWCPNYSDHYPGNPDYTTSDDIEDLVKRIMCWIEHHEAIRRRN